MNRVTTILLSVLIALVAANCLLVLRADQRTRDDAEHAREDATKQACIERSQGTAIISVLIPAIVSSTDKETRDARIQALGALGTQLDAC